MRHRAGVGGRHRKSDKPAIRLVMPNRNQRIRARQWRPNLHGRDIVKNARALELPEHRLPVRARRPSMCLEDLDRLPKATSAADEFAQASPCLLQRLGRDRGSPEGLLAEEVLDRLGPADAAEPVQSPGAKCTDRDRELQVKRQDPPMHAFAVEGMAQSKRNHRPTDEGLAQRSGGSAKAAGAILLEQHVRPQPPEREHPERLAVSDMRPHGAFDRILTGCPAHAEEQQYAEPFAHLQPPRPPFHRSAANDGNLARAERLERTRARHRGCSVRVPRKAAEHPDLAQRPWSGPIDPAGPGELHDVIAHRIKMFRKLFRNLRPPCSCVPAVAPPVGRPPDCTSARIRHGDLMASSALPCRATRSRSGPLSAFLPASAGFGHGVSPRRVRAWKGPCSRQALGTGPQVDSRSSLRLLAAPADRGRRGPGAPGQGRQSDPGPDRPWRPSLNAFAREPRSDASPPGCADDTTWSTLASSQRTDRFAEPPARPLRER